MAAISILLLLSLIPETAFALQIQYHNDHLGSTTVITDEQGNLVEKTEYYPYGEVREGGTRSKYLYTGQELDSETGLYYYGARYYDPDLARFVQPDPVIQDVYDPQNLNRYSYVRNNPLKYVDPTGNQWQELGYRVLSFGFGAITEFVAFTSEYSAAMIPMVVYTNEEAYDEAGWEGVTVNTAGLVLGPKIINSLGGRVASIAARTQFARQLSSAVKESSPGLYNSLKNAKTIATGSDFKSSLAKETALTEDVTVGRYFGGEARQESQWFTTVGTESSVLDLPAGNTAEKFVGATLPQGTKVQVGFTKSGGLQIYIPDEEWNRIKDMIKWEEPKKVG